MRLVIFTVMAKSAIVEELLTQLLDAEVLLDFSGSVYSCSFSKKDLSSLVSSPEKAKYSNLREIPFVCTTTHSLMILMFPPSPPLRLGSATSSFTARPL